MTKYLQPIHHQLTLHGEPIIDSNLVIIVVQREPPRRPLTLKFGSFFSSNLGDGAFSYVLQWIIYLILVL